MWKNNTEMCLYKGSKGYQRVYARFCVCPFFTLKKFMKKENN